MSTAADNEYEAQNDVPAAGSDIPTGEAGDNDYTSRVGQKTAPVPVQKDEDPVEDPIDPATADTDEQLAKDDADAIDESNIVDGRTRGAKPVTGGYREPGDDEGLPGPGDTGKSAITQ